MATPTSSYARLLAHYPYVIIAISFLIVATCLIVAAILGDRPDFDNPKNGFQARGTQISGRLMAYENLVRNEENTVNLTPFPQQYTQTVLDRARKQKQQSKASRHDKKKKGRRKYNVTDDDDGDDEEDEEEVKKGPPGFCASLPDRRYSRVVYASMDHGDLMTATNIRSMCRLERRIIRSYPDFRSICDKTNKRCCLSWSLGNVIAALTNKTRCRDIGDADVVIVHGLLHRCATMYRAGALNPDCVYDGCANTTSECMNNDMVYLLLHYLMDNEYLTSSDTPLSYTSSDTPLSYTSSFLPLVGGIDAIRFYKFMESQSLQEGNVEIQAANFGIKYMLFDEMMQVDTVWLIIAGFIVFISIWAYSASIFITIMTILAMFWSLEVAYFLYTLVFEIAYFPYMNLITVIVIIGVGADDVLIYCKVWHLAKSERNNGTLEKIVTDTLRHATLSMLVTSLTTAAAFFANFVSNITAIQCFSIYAGTTMLVNYVLMVTWIPASIVIYEKWCDCCFCYSSTYYAPKSKLWCNMCRVPYKLYNCISESARIFFDKLLPCFVIKLRYLWFILFTCLQITALLIIFVYPKLQIPSAPEFQVFSDDHLMEVYDFKLVKHFSFERDTMNLPITIVWGALPLDNGAHLDPQSYGELVLDEEFTLITREAQSWIMKFCSDLRNTEFYQYTPGMQITNCFLENFKVYMERPCSSDIKPCCDDSMFPYSESVMTQCLGEYMSSVKEMRGLMYNHQSPGPRFSNGRVSALIIEFLSNASFSFSYDEMNQFYTKVNGWVKKEITKAPLELQRGWFVSDFEFYDLQDSLIHGTPLAIGLSLAVATIVTFLTTLNLLITIYAMLTITGVIFVTTASLVLLGWQLNIVESVILTVTIGLSIDYTLHYAVAYHLSVDADRELRVVASISRMGSAILMAAITTFLAGAAMMPATVLAYRQFGVFLMIIVAVSWVYSTFYFQSLLRLFGPHGGFGQFHWPSLNCCFDGSPRHAHVDKTVYALSESTLSSSSTGTTSHRNSESHELAPLTDHIDGRPSSNRNQRRHHHHDPRQHHHPRVTYSRTSNISKSPVLPRKHDNHVTFDPSTAGALTPPPNVTFDPSTVGALIPPPQTEVPFTKGDADCDNMSTLIVDINPLTTV